MLEECFETQSNFSSPFAQESSTVNVPAFSEPRISGKILPSQWTTIGFFPTKFDFDLWAKLCRASSRFLLMVPAGSCPSAPAIGTVYLRASRSETLFLCNSPVKCCTKRVSFDFGSEVLIHAAFFSNEGWYVSSALDSSELCLLLKFSHESISIMSKEEDGGTAETVADFAFLISSFSLLSNLLLLLDV